jgi:hypothetical protein
MVSRCAAERRLGAEELDDLRGTLASLCLWSREQSHAGGAL